MSNKGTSLSKVRLLISLILALPMLVCLVERPSAAGPSVSAVKDANQRIETYDAWLNAPWTDNDAPYGDLRRTIDIALVSPSDPAAIVRKYENQFRKSPTDLGALFAFGYASFKAAGVPKGISRAESQANLDNLYLPIAASRVRPPHTYNFTRLGFLAVADLNNHA